MSPVPTKTVSASASASFNHNYDDLSSSPDPLTASFDGDNIVGSVASGNRRSGSGVFKAEGIASRTTHHDFGTASRTSHHDFGTIPSSPFRAVSEQNISPWKIRVTVEAEQEDSEMDTTSTRRVTRTVRIPLRPDFAPEDGGAGAGSVRGTRAQGSPGKPKRGATPVKSAYRTRRQSVTDLNVRPLGDDADEDDWLRQKRSPRKRKAAGNRKNVSGNDTAAPTSSSSSQEAGKQTASAFEIRPDTDAESDDGIAYQEAATTGRDSAELRHVDLNQVATRSRAFSTKSIADGGAETQASRNLNTLGAVSRRNSGGVRKVSVNSAKSYPTPSPTSSYRGDSDEVGKALDDASGDHEGFDTILESEGFTMIDLETLPSAKQYFSPAATEAHQPAGGSEEASSKQGPSAAPNSAGGSTRQAEHSAESQMIAYPSLNADDSDISSTVPSSPPVQEHEKSLLQVSSSSSNAGRKVTPQPYSSPKLPSPPKQDSRRTPQHRHRGSISALVAGITLQGVVSPKQSGEGGLVREKRTSSPSGEPARLFQGFDSGTQREMRAGLRFGEELARRQSPEHSTTVAVARKECKPVGLGITTTAKVQSHSSRQATTQVWRGENLVRRTPVQAAASTAAKVTELEKSPPQTPQGQTSKEISEKLLDTQARREAEWQLERDANIREIQNANSSQVIVIDSDSEEEEQARPEARTQPSPAVVTDGQEDGNDEDDDEDIWLAEAMNSSSPGPEPPALSQSHGDEFILNEQTKQPQQANQAASRPRRSLIPSPWKRGDDIEPPSEHTSFVSTKTDDMSGLWYYKEGESKVKFGAGEIKRQQLRQRNSSGRFDIDLMAGTPKKEGLQRKHLEESSESSIHGGVEEDSVEPSVSEDVDESVLYNDDGHTSNAVDESESAHADESRLSTTEDQKAGHDSNEHIMDDHETASPPAQPVQIVVSSSDTSPANVTPPSRDTYSRSTQLQPPSPEQPFLSSPQRPATPRSALKGSRQSFGEGLMADRPDTPTMIRRVVFSERSRGVDIDGLESSFSMRSGSDDSTTAGELDGQLNRELQAHEMSRSGRGEDEPEEETESEDDIREHHQYVSTNARVWVPVDVSRRVKSAAPPPIPAPASQPESVPVKQGWTSWLWGSNATTQVPRSSSYQRHDEHRARSMAGKPYSNSALLDGTKDEYEYENDNENDDDNDIGSDMDNANDYDPHDEKSGWQKTKSSIPSSSSSKRMTAPASQPRPGSELAGNSRSYPQPGPRTTANKTTASTHQPSSSGSLPSTTPLPSYLLPPSYPSDPTRSPSTPLPLNGQFTNTHFRTLHIIYRKSLRPRFHAPPRHTIRPEIMALEGTEVEVDETSHMGVDEVFVWKVGVGECEVLERFMQECEFGWGVWRGREVKMGSGSRTGKIGERAVELGKQVNVHWGWTVQQLAEWLCRIVVGEVVREEERKGKEREKKKGMAKGKGKGDGKGRERGMMRE